MADIFPKSLLAEDIHLNAMFMS